MHPQTYFQMCRQNHDITPTNNSIWLPPDTASFIAALKGRDYFPYFQGNGFYISYVFVNQTPISQKAAGITLISFTVFVKARQCRLELLRFPTVPACLVYMFFLLKLMYLQWNKTIKVQTTLIDFPQLLKMDCLNFIPLWLFMIKLKIK